MHSFILGLSRVMAYLGGLVLTGLIVLTCVSVAGRSLNGILHSDLVQSVAPGVAAWLLGLGIGPVNGDFELVEAGMAFAIFAFLPLCQVSGAHASVDIFTALMPVGFNRYLRLFIEIVFAAVLVLIAWELFGGLLSKMRSGQTTLLLQFPLWWAYAASFIGAAVTALVGVYIAAMRLVEVATGRVILPADVGAGH